ncbi:MULTISPECIES: hypothetical protein [Methylobacterium]|uniref:Uncharacterized protein n=1 Tax=Methylobacterium thuringiense TaxID=1003091 RepID=A0ABQ4TNR5_9HYPH|nr:MULTISPECIES: hypothetical protein [Methylobacterium]TXN22094.1 hypothetical protein FV217_11940 [Methylobacterium sp. WL9]GJE56636.1 hypothetical protein EKPJFOCH_3144 [Methylobacterium thuringiense]
MMLTHLRRWITEHRPRQAAVEAEAQRLIARHGTNAPLVARALSGPPGRPSPYGRKVAKRVDQIAKRRNSGRP